MEIIICEDDKKQLTALHNKIKTMVDEKTKICLYTSGNELFQDIDTFSSYAIFLMDIVLDDTNGVEIAKRINHRLPQASIIFITAYLNMVTEIFDTQHCYFILKKELDNRLPIALQKAIEEQHDKKRNILLTQGSEKIVLQISDILYIERKKRTSIIMCMNNEFHTSSTLDDLLKTLPMHTFQRCHNSYVINFQHVYKMKRNGFTLYNETLVPISRLYYYRVKEAFESYIMQSM